MLFAHGVLELGLDVVLAGLDLVDDALVAARHRVLSVDEQAVSGSEDRDVVRRRAAQTADLGLQLRRQSIALH
jgi:hypothetical protein